VVSKAEAMVAAAGVDVGAHQKKKKKKKKINPLARCKKIELAQFLVKS